MNILYINHYAGSPEMGMEFRPYYLAREWAKRGHNVTIIAGDYSHLRRKNPVVNNDFQIEFIDGIKYSWVKTNSYDGNGVSRAKTMYQFVHKIRKNANMIIDKERPDVVITSSTYPLDTYAGQKIKKLHHKAVLVHEIHDMWPITLTEVGGMSKMNPFVVAMQIGENSFCKKSDYICSLLPCAKDYLVEHGMSPNKFFSISNGVVLNEWQDYQLIPNTHKELFEKLHKEEQFIICFFGSHTKSYNLDYLVSAVESMDEDVVAVFVGNGIYKEELMSKCNQEKGKCYFLDSIPKQSIPDLFNYIDATYVAAVDNDMFRFGICMNKLFDSMMGGKPILYAVNAPNNYIIDYNCGINIETENKEALMNAIKELINMDSDERTKLGQNGRNAVLNNYVYERLADDFINHIEGEINND